MRNAIKVLIPLGSGVSTYSIAGFVYDADGTTAVASATVALGTASTTSGVDGSYIISGLASGASGTLTATKSGYSFVSKTIAAMSGNLTAQNFTNWWWAFGGISANCIAAYQPKNAVNYASSKINLANPGTYNAVDGVVAYPSWTADGGWAFVAASTQWLTTNIVPADGWSAVVKYTGVTDGTNNQYLFGTRDGSTVTRFFVIINAAAANTVVYGLGGSASVSPKLLAGIVGFAAHQGYRGGTADGSAIGAWTGGASQKIIIGALGGADVNPGDGTYLTGSIEALAFFDTDIVTQIAGMMAAMVTLPPNP